MESSEQRELRSLVERIREGHCVLVLGPRVAVSTDKDGKRHPLDEVLAAELWRESGAPPDDFNLRRAADAYMRAQGDRYMLTTRVKDFYADQPSQTTDFHRDLAHLPFRLCLTATPDDSMTVAFHEAGKDPQRSHYDFNGGTAPPLRDATETRPIVYHLFGHLEDASSLVLTEVDLIRFLVAIVKERPALPDQIRSLLGDTSASCLFVGFQLHQWYLRVLLEVLNLYKPNRGVALEDVDFFQRPDRSEVAAFFTGTRRIDFRQVQWDAFAKDLRAMYEAKAKKGESGSGSDSGDPQRALAPNAPKAFVSYASEDVDQVDVLKEALEERGVDVWKDKQDLCVGQKWEKALKKVIEQDVQYVIVVQTENMLRRAEGVFHKEIGIAAGRQSNMAEGLLFILPVTIGRCNVLPSLTEYHVIDASTPEGIDQLAKAIHEDWKKRAAMTMPARAAV